MPRRRPPPRRRATAPLPNVMSSRTEEGPDGYEYEVRPVAGSRAQKAYRCPGCDHEVKPGVAHVVVWRVDAGEAAVDERRHWHTSCWTNGRSPTRRWS